MAHNYSNTASTAQLDAPLNSSSNVFQVTGLTGYPAAPFFVLMDRDTSSAELMEVTQVAGSTLTATRGAGGTASTSHAAGATVEHVIPAAVPQAVEAHIEASTNIHGITGALVGADDNTTLTNKTYRGAGRHVYSDTLPASPAAGFIVEADSSISRDGFVAAGVGANADRSGFLLTQSGAERFKARYDGTVQVNPSGASSHPAVEVTGTVVAEDLTVNNDVSVLGQLSVIGDMSAGSSTVANANVAQQLAVTGASTLGQVTASGLVTANSGLTVNSGTTTTTGPITVAAGNVTLSGADARVGLPASPTALSPGTVTGQIRYRNKAVEAWDQATGNWYNQGGMLGLGTVFNMAGGHITASRALLYEYTFSGYASAAPYNVMVQGQCEVNNATGGSRWDLFCTIDDENPDPGGANVLAVGVGNGFTQTGTGVSARLQGAHTFRLVLERTVGGGGESCDVTAFNQSFTVMVIPSGQTT
jgi:hypothetical protein